MAIANPAIWRPDTTQWAIADLLIEAGFTQDTPRQQWHGIRVNVRFAADLDERKRAQSSLTTDLRVGEGVLTFKGRRTDGSYGALDLNDQGKRYWYRIKDIMTAIHTYGWDRAAGLAAAAEENAQIEPDPEPDPEPVAEPTGFDPKAEMRWFVKRVREIRTRLAETDPDLDHLSYRPIKDGRKMIEAGIPAKACLYAMTLHWDEQSRAMYGIEKYDIATEFPGGVHAYLDTLVKARVHIFLFGEAGFGKSYWAEKLAERIGVEFEQLPCNEGVSPSWILGKDTASGFKESDFQRTFRADGDGGVFLLDEIDRSDSNILVTLNGPLASDKLSNPVQMRKHDRHDDNIIVAAGNSLGYGSNKYHSANELDPSTLDRLRMGRVEIGYDRDVEDLIAFG